MTLETPGLPTLEWTNGPGTAQTPRDDTLRLIATAGADWTNDAFGGPQQHAATLLGFTPAEDFTLSVRVTVRSERTTFDAGALAIWGDKNHWAKLCFEYSLLGRAMVVSVVTKLLRRLQLHTRHRGRHLPSHYPIRDRLGFPFIRRRPGMGLCPGLPPRL